MKSMLLALALSAATVSTAWAADTAASAPALTPQQNKMASCNKDAAGKAGDERKAFMKECLSAQKPMTQQDRMKACNKDATGKTGDERKAFMKECLSS